MSAYCPQGSKSLPRFWDPSGGRRCYGGGRSRLAGLYSGRQGEPAWSSCARRWESRRRRPLPLGITGTTLPCFTGLAGAT